MTQLGQNDSGDFDQLSLHGVDFGENYTADYGIIPTNLEGFGMHQQLGEYGHGYYDQLGGIPEGLDGIPAGLDGIPEGMGQVPALNQGPLGHYAQLGCGENMGHYQQLGYPYSQLGFLPAALTRTVGVGPVQLPVWGWAVGALAAIAFVPQLKGIKKKIPVLKNL